VVRLGGITMVLHGKYYSLPCDSRPTIAAEFGLVNLLPTVLIMGSTVI